MSWRRLLLDLTHQMTQKGAVTRYLYDQNDQLIKEIQPYGYEAKTDEGTGMVYGYDCRGNRVRSINGLGQLVKELAYNLQDLPVMERDGLGNETGLDYMPDGQVKTVTRGIGDQKRRVQGYEYNARGQITGIVDGVGEKVSYDVDHWGRITEVGFSDGVKEQYTYSPAGQVINATDGNGNTVEYRFNSQGKVRERIDQMGYTERFQYDECGNLSLYVDRNGNQVHRIYNVFGNPVYEKATDKNGENAVVTTYGYDSVGRLTRAVCDGYSYEYYYNEQGLLAEKRSSGKRLISYEYDNAGQMIRMTNPEGITVSYEYDLLGRMSRIYNSSDMEVRYEYDCLDRLEQVTYGNGIMTRYQYDDSGKVSCLETKVGEESLLSFWYEYDGNGNRTSKMGEQKLAGGESSSLSVTYQYDIRGQLLKENRNGKAVCYIYDASGNRLQKANQEEITSYFYNEKNQLVCEEGSRGKRNFIYNPQGSIIREESPLGTRKFLYNTKNQQTEVRLEEGSAQANRYDAENLRCEMRENEKLIQFVYHRGELLYERGEENQTSYYLGAGIEASQIGQKVYYYHRDEQLSTALITDVTREIQNHYQYDAFGWEVEKTEYTSNRIRYTGQQYDVQTEQYYLRARYYNPMLGRFMQEDSYLNDGLNLYAYCKNNPVVYYDPSGYTQQKDLATTLAGMTYDEKIDALYMRRNEYIQNKIDSGKLTVSEALLQMNELEVGSFSTIPRDIGDGVTPHHMPSAHSIDSDGIEYNKGACLNTMGGTHAGTFTYGLNASSRPYDNALYESLTYADRLEFDRADIQDIYKRFRPNVPQDLVEQKLREQYELAMRTQVEADEIKSTKC